MENNNKKKDNIKVDNLNDRIKAALKNKNEKKGSQNVLKSNSKTETGKLKESKFAIKSKNSRKTGKETVEKIQLTAQEQKKFEKKKAARRYVNMPIEAANDSIQNKIKSAQEEIEAEDNPAHAAYLKISDKANKKVEKKVNSLNNSIGTKKDLKTKKEIVDKRDNYKSKRNLLSEEEKKAARKKRIKRMYAKKKVYEEAEKQGTFPSKVGQKNKEKKSLRIVDTVVTAAIWIFVILLSLAASVAIIVFSLVFSAFFGVLNVGGSVWNCTTKNIDLIEQDWLYREAQLRQGASNIINNKLDELIDDANEEGIEIDVRSYEYDVSLTHHDMFMLMNYYSAVYDKVDYNTVKDENAELINLVYPAEVITSVEFREVTNEETTLTEAVVVIQVQLTPLKDVIMSRMDDDQKKIYDKYNYTSGGMQCYSGPFEGWRNYIALDPHYGAWYDSTNDKVMTNEPEGSADYLTLEGDLLVDKSIYSLCDGEIVNVWINTSDNSTYCVECKGDARYRKYVIYGLKDVDVNIGDAVTTSTSIGKSSSRIYIRTFARNDGLDYLGHWHNPEYLME